MASSRKKPSTEGLVASIRAALEKSCRTQDRLAVAFSGGLDSTTLLHVLSRHAAAWGFPSLSAVYINHGLSPNADRWSAYCAQICKAWNVPFETKRVRVVARGEGIEAAAREARYAAMAEVEADWILLGHHQEDQAETLLLNLCRGAGLSGMAAMEAIRGRYLRPMLDLPREAIQAYAKESELRWIDDESNIDEHYTRNFLRARIFPILRERFPAVSGNLARAAQLTQDSVGLLDDLARLDQGATGLLAIDRLKRITTARALNLLAYKLREGGGKIPSRKQLEELLRQLLEAASDAAVRFVFGDREVRRFQGRMYVLPSPWTRPAPRAWTGEESLPWGRSNIRIRRTVGQGLREQAMRESPVTFSCRKGGESLRLHSAAPRRRLKDLLREAGFPPWVRDSLPLMFAADELVWVPGIGVAEQYRCGAEEMGISLEFDGPNW